MFSDAANQRINVMTNFKRIITLAAIATIALGAAPAAAARKPPPTGPVVLFNQMGGLEYTPGWDPQSQHQSEGTEVQSAADDFTVPSQRTWTLTSVEVGGEVYRSTIGGVRNDPARFDVTVYRADGPEGGPGTLEATVSVAPTKTVCCTDARGWLLALPSITVGAGQHWISVAAVLDPLLEGKFYWRAYSTQNDAIGRYHSPTSNGWQSLVAPHDLELRLTGTSS